MSHVLFNFVLKLLKLQGFLGLQQGQGPKLVKGHFALTCLEKCIVLKKDQALQRALYDFILFQPWPWLYQAFTKVA